MHMPQDFRTKSKFSDTLEQRAWDVINSSTHGNAEIRRELALTLQHLENLRRLHDDMEDSVGESRRSVKTELLRAQRQVSPYSSSVSSQRDWSRSGLLALEAERRRNAVSHQERINQLHERILALLAEQADMVFDDELGQAP